MKVSVALVACSLICLETSETERWHNGKFKNGENSSKTFPC